MASRTNNATREYVVLEKRKIPRPADATPQEPLPVQDAWVEVDIVRAWDGDQAIRHVHEVRNPDKPAEGTYRAIVRTAWEPLVRIALKREVKIILEHGAKKGRPAPEQAQEPDAKAARPPRPKGNGETSEGIQADLPGAQE